MSAKAFENLEVIDFLVCTADYHEITPAIDKSKMDLRFSRWSRMVRDAEASVFKGGEAVLLDKQGKKVKIRAYILKSGKGIKVEIIDDEANEKTHGHLIIEAINNLSLLPEIDE